MISPIDPVSCAISPRLSIDPRTAPIDTPRSLIARSDDSREQGRETCGANGTGDPRASVPLVFTSRGQDATSRRNLDQAAAKAISFLINSRLPATGCFGPQITRSDFLIAIVDRVSPRPRKLPPEGDSGIDSGRETDGDLPISRASYPDARRRWPWKESEREREREDRA